MVEQAGGRTLIVVADGAGGTGRGAAAAEMACSMVAAAFRRGAMSSDGWVAELLAIDRHVLTGALGGQTTVVAVEIDGTEVRGASVGDSGCWAIDPLDFMDLTSSQDRKPLLGALEELISKVRLRSGKFQDDVAIALCDSG